ncbi:hypothetical protein [Azospirillum palustre]
MIGEPLLETQIDVHRARAAGADALEERSIVHRAGRNTGLRHPHRGSILSGERGELSSVIHGEQNAGNFPHGQAHFPASFPAFTDCEHAGSIPHMSDTFFDRIERRLIATGQTEEAASKRAGRNRGYIRDLKRKKSVPNSKNIAGLAVALECSSEYLLGIMEDPGAPPVAKVTEVVADEPPITDDERLLITIYRALPDEDKKWIWQQVLREAEKAGIAIDDAE